MFVDGKNYIAFWDKKIISSIICIFLISVFLCPTVFDCVIFEVQSSRQWNTGKLRNAFFSVAMRKQSFFSKKNKENWRVRRTFLLACWPTWSSVWKAGRGYLLPGGRLSQNCLILRRNIWKLVVGNSFISMFCVHKLYNWNISNLETKYFRSGRFVILYRILSFFNNVYIFHWPFED